MNLASKQHCSYGLQTHTIHCKTQVKQYSCMCMMFLDDYFPGPFGITFSPGQTRQSLFTFIEDDIILESDEVFSYSIDSSSFPNGVTTGNFATINITILDDECK